MSANPAPPNSLRAEGNALNELGLAAIFCTLLAGGEPEATHGYSASVAYREMGTDFLTCWQMTSYLRHYPAVGASGSLPCAASAPASVTP
ncbi:hypothetical protein SAMN05421666_2418 [Roseovarius nanhaiticus]|uniref:Uncharacterized protein n=1 Tax=Roseovarius nanhaiticus TaxID=573024 RepID=A0A1N7H2Y6_9RHOB|nr:hypothetical protein SAMN05216208_2901 [Roseovarius nanhaiticus]SIS19202.1 hypothetical protein SAMN05421666_2418 [Roseovarius nanhaiticus]